MGTQGVSQCFGCGVVGEGEEDIDDGNFYCFACWLIYHTARAQLRQNTTHVHPARNLQGVSYTPGSAQHERSVGTVSPTLGRRPQLHRPDSCMEHQQIKPAHQSPRKQRMRVAVKPSSLKSEVGIRVLTPTPVTQLLREVKNTSTRASM